MCINSYYVINIVGAEGLRGRGRRGGAAAEHARGELHKPRRSINMLSSRVVVVVVVAVAVVVVVVVVYSVLKYTELYDVASNRADAMIAAA